MNLRQLLKEQKIELEKLIKSINEKCEGKAVTLEYYDGSKTYIFHSICEYGRGEESRVCTIKKNGKPSKPSLLPFTSSTKLNGVCIMDIEVE